MRKAFILAVAVLLLGGCATVERHPWTARDKAMFATACAANAFDFYTTKRVLDNGGYIKGPWNLLYFGDDTPSTAVLAASKVAQLVVAKEVLDFVPSDWRAAVLMLMTGTWVYYGATN